MSRTAAWMLLGWAALSGCTTCGEHVVGEATYGERCGVAGSWGHADTIGDGANWLLFEPLGDRHASDDGAENPRPAVVVGFAGRLLVPDTELERGDLLAQCLRFDDTGEELYAWHATEATVTVVRESGRSLVGDRPTQSWRLRWSVDCPDAAMHSEGNDVLELFEGGSQRFHEYYGPVPGVDG